LNVLTGSYRLRQLSVTRSSTCYWLAFIACVFWAATRCTAAMVPTGGINGGWKSSAKQALQPAPWAIYSKELQLDGLRTGGILWHTSAAALANKPAGEQPCTVRIWNTRRTRRTLVRGSNLRHHFL